MPVNTTEVSVNIRFMAWGQITLNPNTFHSATINNGNPGKTTLGAVTLLS